VAIAVTVDAVVLTMHARELHVLLIQRGRDPFRGRWALPGGFLEPEEDLEAAARRELAEETGIALPCGALRQVGAYGSPGRDPRGPTVSIAFAAIVPDLFGVGAGGDDAAAARWFPVLGLPSLAFDHDAILRDALGTVGASEGAA